MENLSTFSIHWPQKNLFCWTDRLRREGIIILSFVIFSRGRLATSFNLKLNFALVEYELMKFEKETRNLFIKFHSGQLSLVSILQKNQLSQLIFMCCPFIFNLINLNIKKVVVVLAFVWSESSHLFNWNETTKECVEELRMYFMWIWEMREFKIFRQVKLTTFAI